MPTHKLLITDGNAKGSEIAIAQDELLIGRLAGPEGTLGDDPELSRRHARVAPTADGGLEIEDLGSTNGTYLDRAKVTGPTRVPQGVPVRIGKTVIELRS